MITKISELLDQLKDRPLDGHIQFQIMKKNDARFRYGVENIRIEKTHDLFLGKPTTTYIVLELDE